MGLETYRAKRNFALTPEPRGRHVAGAADELSFVVQKHAASHLHYDFRLELDGVLLSWAVPRGPSLDPADKRLAIHVEDHPLEYGGFEGIIPERQYGAGTVMLWDSGTWVPQGDPAAAYAKGHLKFTLRGSKLHGEWNLVRTRGSAYGGKSGDKAWLLIKVNDRYARKGGGPIADADDDRSVKTARSMKEIARSRSHVWQSNRSVAENVRGGAIARRPSRAAKLPATLAPMLATLVAEPPRGDDWVHELKYDGYRMVCRIERGKARLYSRTGKEWSAVFPSIVADLAALPVKSAWIDGEVVVMDAKGRTSFQALQNALSGERFTPLDFFAFDIPYLDGHDHRRTPLTERKRLLRDIVSESAGRVHVGPESEGDGEEFFRQACALGIEGIVSKKAASLYHSGARSREWLKVKCLQRQEMVIGGYTDPRGSRQGFGALLLGYHEGGQLRYSGKVGTGFDDATLRTLLPQLEKRERASAPFVDPPRGYEARGAHWLEPELVAEIAFTEWSADGALRHPSFQGLRMDKKAADVVRERPAADATAKVEIAGIKLSNPGKLYFPEAEITKRELAEYYERVSKWLLPHIANRPLSLVRCPDGWPKQCFYQKHADASVDESASRIEVPEGRGTATYLGARTAKALVALVQWGVIELHPWGSRTPRLGRPDRLIFDFDPDDSVGFDELKTAVELLRGLLDEIALSGFLKTTGGKGLHVVLPIRPTLDWDAAKRFTKGIAQTLVDTFPDRFTSVMSKKERTGRIFIDYLRNAEGATAVAPYTARARKNAPVATPIGWEELDRDIRFDHFNVRNVPERLDAMKRDPWAEFATTRQTISAALQKRFA